MDWYYATNGQQNGPVSDQQLIELFQSGQVKATDLVWNETMTDWLPFRSVPELSAAVPASAPVEEAAPPLEEPAPEAPPTDTAPAQEAASPLSPVVTQASLPASGEKVPTYLWQSIVCLILCCLPAAIPALVFSTKVDPALQAGNYAAAKEASDKARMWCWIAFGVGLVANILVFVLSFVGSIMQEM